MYTFYSVSFIIYVFSEYVKKLSYVKLVDENTYQHYITQLFSVNKQLLFFDKNTT